MSATYNRGKIPGAGPHGGPLYLPVHSLCLELSDRYIENATTSNQKAEELPIDIVTSVKQLWEALYRRLFGSIIPEIGGELPEPHEYFGGRLCRNVYWELGDNPAHGKYVFSNNCEINQVNNRAAT
jgi:hypothetical protein